MLAAREGFAPVPALLGWFDRHRRDLPWRRTRDPYRIWVSEVMLQQTQVATVVSYYARFLRRFPTLRSVAAAPRPEVLAAWRGLGYYARARALHRAAQAVADAGGDLPGTAAALVRLPGFGRYTAGAVASIAFGERTPVVDGNVARVLARYEAIRGDIRTASVRERLWSLAGEWVPADRPGDFNQALMELGALVCARRGPRCGECPIARGCRARAQGLVDLIPARAPGPRRRRLALALALVRRGRRVLLARRAETGLFGGLWELPATEARGKDALERAATRDLGLRLAVGAPVARVERALTHRDLVLEVRACRVRGGRLRPQGRYVEARFVNFASAGRLGMSTAMAQALAAGVGTCPARATRTPPAFDGPTAAPARAGPRGGRVSPRPRTARRTARRRATAGH